MFFNKVALVGASLMGFAAALPPRGSLYPRHVASCSSYTLINTRGTFEPQQESVGFMAVNAKVHSQRPGGKTYNTVYPADMDQNSTAGTEDILNHIHSTLASNAAECFILEGYSQGATATVDALSRLNGTAFAAVKGVVLIGNPTHKAGLACNVDLKGQNSTYDVDGLFVLGDISKGVPANWVPKTLDVCNYADGVCDTKHGSGINVEHIAYITDEGSQTMEANYILRQLQSNATSPCH